MAIIKEYAELDGLALAAHIKAGDFTAGEVLDTVYHLLDALNPKINAVVRELRDEARREVEHLSTGPFEGAPIVLKDEYLSVAGVPNDHSSRLAAGWVRDYDTYLVQDYRKAGLQIVGKSNLPELGASVTTDASLYGPCSTPWDLSRNSGGSSGGSASAVAAGIVPLGYSNDGGGSIRIPASCCGAFGLKPTRARVSTGPDGGEYWNGLVIEHAITRSVRDSAALLDLTDGAKPGDYYCAPPKTRPFLDEVGAPPGKLRIAYSATPPYDTPVHPDCVAAMEDTAKLCEDLGHELVEASPEFDGRQLTDYIGALFRVHLALGLKEMAALTRRPADADHVERATMELARRGGALSAVELLEMLEFFTSTARRVAPFFEQYDVFLTPTLASPPVKNGYIYTDDPDADRYIRRKLDFIPFTPIANVAGLPAMTVPLNWNAEGLPIGTHFIGRFGDEATLFRLAAQLEEARPWSLRTPPVHARHILGAH